MENMNCKTANGLDLVDWLEKLGYTPQNIRGNDYWYISPLRDEKTASFKVNRRKNIWYDHGLGKGGTLVDFGKLYYRCSVKQLLARLSDTNALNVSFHPPALSFAGEKKDPTINENGKIKIISDKEVTHKALKDYLQSRQIPMIIARKYCREICFELYGKKHLAIGFKNPGGGYELRNRYFKGSSAPKEPRLIQQQDSAKSVAVFEGFFSFLSYETLKHIRNKNNLSLSKEQADSLVLNSLSFFENSRKLMEKYATIHLCLDRDKMGQQYTAQALKWSDKYKDQSLLYEGHKDLNEYLIQSVNTGLKRSQSKGMRL
jgi:hypothetical protein